LNPYKSGRLSVESARRISWLRIAPESKDAPMVFCLSRPSEKMNVYISSSITNNDDIFV